MVPDLLLAAALLHDLTLLVGALRDLLAGPFGRYRRHFLLYHMFFLLLLRVAFLVREQGRPVLILSFYGRNRQLFWYLRLWGLVSQAGRRHTYPLPRGLVEGRLSPLIDFRRVV